MAAELGRREEAMAHFEALATDGFELIARDFDLDLLTKEQVLEKEAPAAAEGASERGDEEAEEFDHARQDRR